MRWGLFGGTFDPIHVGHLRCAEEVREMFRLDQVIFIPAARPPHKSEVAVTPFVHRVKMISLAISDNPFFTLSEVENLRTGKSYSIETVRYFLDTVPSGTKLFFIVGQDTFAEITTWKDWEQLLFLCDFVVMTRGGRIEKGFYEILPPPFTRRYYYDAAIDGYLGPSGKAIFFRRVSLLDVSSTEIRSLLEAGRSVRYLIPDTVLEYVNITGCYRPSR